MENLLLIVINRKYFAIKAITNFIIFTYFTPTIVHIKIKLIFLLFFENNV
jgi:hypothetical protein